jgi:hypothetical protein
MITEFGAFSAVIANPMVGGEAPTLLYRGHSTGHSEVACSKVLEPAQWADWSRTLIEQDSAIAGSMMELKLIRNAPAVVYYLEEEAPRTARLGPQRPPPDGDWTIIVAEDVDIERRHAPKWR